VLSVNGAARWVLEIKAPSENITHDVIEQAISYAAHPEVYGYYVAILNGKRFVLLHRFQYSEQVPLVDIPITSVHELAASLRPLLSPAAIRRDCAPPTVDMSQPLADGYRSSASIIGGTVSNHQWEWQCNLPMPEGARVEMDNCCSVMSGVITSVTGGRIWRDENSKIRAQIQCSIPHANLFAFASDKGLLSIEYISLDSVISSSHEKQSIFDVNLEIKIDEGENIYNMLKWKNEASPVALSMNVRGQAFGYIMQNKFFGNFESEYESCFPDLPGFSLSMYGTGSVELDLDPR